MSVFPHLKVREMDIQWFPTLHFVFVNSQCLLSINFTVIFHVTICVEWIRDKIRVDLTPCVKEDLSVIFVSFVCIYRRPLFRYGLGRQEGGGTHIILRLRGCRLHTMWALTGNLTH